MSEIKITYETLFDLLRRERNREELQPLEQSFSEDVLAYMAQKHALTNQINKNSFSSEAEKARIQFHNIKKILKELYDRREKKITLLALNATRTGIGSDTNNFLSHENLLYNELMSLYSKQRRDFLDTLLQQIDAPQSSSPTPKAIEPEKGEEKKVEEAPKPATDTVKIKFLKAVPRFAGGADQVFGPFTSGDEAELPTKIAQVLIKKNRAIQA